MLFNSFLFIFCFLPIVLVGFFGLARISHKLAAGWLTVASLVFYGWWNADYLALLLASIGFNYVLGRHIARLHEAGLQKRSRQWLALAIVANLALLGYFKYTIFFLSSCAEAGRLSPDRCRKSSCRSAFPSSRSRRSPFSSMRTEDRRASTASRITCCS